MRFVCVKCGFLGKNYYKQNQNELEKLFEFIVLSFYEEKIPINRINEHVLKMGLSKILLRRVRISS